MITRGTDNHSISDIVVKDKEGRQSLHFKQMK